MSKSYTVLIVDDEADIQESMGMVLEESVDGVKIHVAENGATALQILEDIGGDEPVDLILSDYRMPVMDGIEFFSVVRDRYPRIARIMFTAYPDPDLAVRAAKDAGVGMFIAKPFDPSYIAELVRAFAPKDESDVPPGGATTLL